jgi:hypothetical protein
MPYKKHQNSPPGKDQFHGVIEKLLSPRVAATQGCLARETPQPLYTAGVRAFAAWPLFVGHGEQGWTTESDSQILFAK